MPVYPSRWGARPRAPQLSISDASDEEVRRTQVCRVRRSVHRVNRLAVLRDGLDEAFESAKHLYLCLIERRVRLALEETGDLVSPVFDVVVVVHQDCRVVSDARGQVVDNAVVVLDVANTYHDAES